MKLGLILVSLLLGGCGDDCQESMRLGEFELSQNNYERALAHFKRAWAEDSIGCSRVQERIKQVQIFQKNQKASTF